jgi:hypothetical protein
VRHSPGRRRRCLGGEGAVSIGCQRLRATISRLRSRLYETPIEWAEKGVRKEDYVRRWLRTMERAHNYGVYFIFRSMEQGPTFRCTAPKHPTKDPNHRILEAQRSRFTHYYFYTRRRDCRVGHLPDSGDPVAGRVEDGAGNPQAIFPYDHPALFSMTLAFLVTYIVSRLDRSDKAMSAPLMVTPFPWAWSACLPSYVRRRRYDWNGDLNAILHSAATSPSLFTFGSRPSLALPPQPPPFPPPCRRWLKPLSSFPA